MKKCPITRNVSIGMEALPQKKASDQTTLQNMENSNLLKTAYIF